MSEFHTIALALTMICISGCTVNGQHIYTEDGKCLSCWNNPLTGQAINHTGETPKSTKQQPVNSNHNQKSYPLYGLANETSIFASKTYWLKYSDELVNLYHRISGKPYPSADQLASEVNSGSKSVNMLSANYRHERNSFKKTDLGQQLKTEIENQEQKLSKEFLAFPWEIYIDQYDFSKGGFRVCFSKQCENTSKHVINKFGAKKYEFKLDNVGMTFFLKASKSEAREIEVLAAKGTGWNSRRIPVVIFAKAKDTDDSRKWSDGTPYRVVTGELEQLFFMKDWSARSASNLPKAKSAEFIITPNGRG
ncbi:hypothetical protein A9Q81_09835 [Gammaproteobacteria bacterium 42_54_T18]|nr:hypothetical protein A9Q81_09835 [Gammaproteobacteria bacterium 42_54_T18]